MVECDYCAASFEDDDAYRAHLASEHEGELSRIDRRRVEGVDGEEGLDLPTGPLVLGIVLAAAFGLVAFVTLGMGGGGGSGATVNGIEVERTPTAVGSTHYHGLANVTILGERVDFSQPRYQTQARAFHFEGGNGRMWHGHAKGVTLEYAMATLGIDVNESAVTFRGTTYRDASQKYEVRVLVDGEPVDPSSYVLTGASSDAPQKGDRIHIVVEREN